MYTGTLLCWQVGLLYLDTAAEDSALQNHTFNLLPTAEFVQKGKHQV